MRTVAPPATTQGLAALNPGTCEEESLWALGRWLENSAQKQWAPLDPETQWATTKDFRFSVSPSSARQRPHTVPRLSPHGEKMKKQPEP